MCHSVIEIPVILKCSLIRLQTASLTLTFTKSASIEAICPHHQFRVLCKRLKKVAKASTCYREIWNEKYKGSSIFRTSLMVAAQLECLVLLICRLEIKWVISTEGSHFSRSMNLTAFRLL